MAEENYMKQPCKQCPFRHDVKPFLRPLRGTELALHATNPYNSFTCHKTLEHDDEIGHVYGVKSKECAGFMTLQINEGAPIPEGFTPAYGLVYEDSYAMIDAYNDQ